MSQVLSKNKKREEYSRLFSIYYPLVLNALFTRVGDTHEARDICQEIFIIFFEKFDEIENPRHWLFGTMRNMLKRYYEKKTKNRELDIDSRFDDVSLTFVNGMRDTRLIIEEAIEHIEMSEEESVIFEYIAYYNYSYNAVGEILGYSKKTIYMKYSLIVKKIVLYLKNKGVQNIEDLL